MRPSSEILVALVKLIVGAHPRWIGCVPDKRQRLYFANHSSHIDTLAIWSALPIRLRSHTRPVAAQDYWGRGIRRYIASKALGAVLINRNRDDPAANPLTPLIEALSRGESLIIFPEGTRGKEAIPGPFKSGLYHLATQFRDVELIPVYLENLLRSMPKGAILPIPLTCTVRFGAPLTRLDDEDKDHFLSRAREEVVKLAGPSVP
jgi:1-acyl-sn-glycerol-3-phosphate acyltransferase